MGGQRRSMIQKQRDRKLLLALSLLILSSLACFSFEYNILFDEAGNGDGVVHLTETLPIELFKDPESVQSVIDDLENDGWKEVSMQEVGDKYLFTGYYPFSTDPNGSTIKDIFPNLNVKIEESENEYRYFTIQGKFDFTQLSETWGEIANVWAKEGLVADSDILVYKKGDVIFSAEEVQALINKYGPPYAIVQVQMPGQTPVEASNSWSNHKDFMDGKTNTLELTWNPDKKDVIAFKATRRIEPLTYVTETEANAQIHAIIQNYQQTIGSGYLPSSTGLSGFLNNWLLQPVFGGAYTCSDYQQQVILFLDKIRTNPDPNIRNLMNGLDYGPIDTNHEGHLAVVLYQRGTDWTQTGIVLDPWPTQQPEAYPIGEWAEHIWGYDASSPNPDHEGGHLYPHLSGGTPSYPAASEFFGDLSVEKNLAKPSTVLYVGSPVTVLLTMQDGRQVGVLPDGSFINEIGRGVNFYTQPKADGSGELEWLFLLPDTDFDIAIDGLANGEFHAYIGDTTGVYTYGAQEISIGGQATLEVNRTEGPPELLLETGEAVQPVPFSGEEGEDGEEILPVENQDTDEPPPGEEILGTTYGGGISALLIVFCCCSGLLVVVGIGVGIFLYLRKKNQG